MLDFVATFPFDVFLPGMLLTRLIRLFRLSKLVKLLDINRIKRVVKSFFDNSTGADRL